jgi:tetratricopeptide (TPR) repeat protein
MAINDLFISYRRKDTTSVLPLVNELRSQGLSVWFDQDTIDEFAPITDRIREGLANSKALLAWYSIDYPRSRPCQMELMAAYIGAQRDGDPRKRVWVINPEASTAHIQPIELRDEQHVTAPNSRKQYEDLAGIIVKKLTPLVGFLGGIIPMTSPSQYGQHLISARHFVGRITDFWQLHSALSGGATAIISGESTSGLALLSGIGGVGKSLLAEEYALRFGAAYPGGIFWLRGLGNDGNRPVASAEEQSALKADQLRSFAVSVGIPVVGLRSDEIQAKLATKLGNENLPFLWIVDDLASALEADTVRGWLSPHPLGKTIITTRSREYREMGHSLSLGGLPPEEAVELLCSYRKPDSPEDQLMAEGIASDLGYHPLALAVCSRALEAEAGLRSFAEFRTSLANPDVDELELASELEGVLPNGHEKSVAATLLRSVRRLGIEAQDFLRMASSLAPAPIPLSLIVKTFAGVEGLKEPAASHRATLALSGVENSSLAERTVGDGRVVHTLVSRAIRFHDRDDGRRAQLRGALVRILHQILPHVQDIRTHKRLELEVLHARELCAAGIKDADTASLGLWVARHDMERGAYITAANLGAQVLEVRRRLLGENDPDTLAAMNNLASALGAKGDVPGARNLQEQVLELCRRSLGEEHPNTLTAMTNLAETLMHEGDLPGARRLYEQVLELRRRTLGMENLNTFAAMHNLAANLHVQGKLAGARILEERVLKVYLRRRGENDSYTLGSMNNLAAIVGAQGDLPRARELKEKVLIIRRRVLGEEHPLTFFSMSNLAWTLRLLRILPRARELEEQALEGCCRILGEEHPKTITSMSNLALILRAQGDLTGAGKLEEQVLKLRR